MMNQIENEFLDTYKRIDKICADMYSTDNGISEYISQMESKVSRGKYKVPEWESSYRALKHLRWRRNQLVHEINPEECTEEDLRELNNFYCQIMSQQDPLAMLYKAEKPVAVKKSAAKTFSETERHTTSVEGNSRSAKNKVILILAAVVFIAVLIILIAGRA